MAQSPTTDQQIEIKELTETQPIYFPVEGRELQAGNREIYSLPPPIR